MSATQSKNPTGIISKGVKFIAGENEILGLLEIPEIGGTREAIDTTTMADSQKKSIFGIADMGELAFKFIYDNSTATSNFRLLKAMEENEQNGAPVPVNVKIEYPDGTAISFDAVVSVKMDSASVNALMTFTCTLLVQSKMVTTNPVGV